MLNLRRFTRPPFVSISPLALHPKLDYPTGDPEVLTIGLPPQEQAKAVTPLIESRCNKGYPNAVHVNRRS